MTEINDKYRRDQIQKSLDDYRERKAVKTLTLEYRGEERTFEVIRIDPKILLLNHNNNRLSAQLFDHPKKDVVYATAPLLTWLAGFIRTSPLPII